MKEKVKKWNEAFKKHLSTCTTFMKENKKTTILLVIVLIMVFTLLVTIAAL